MASASMSVDFPDPFSPTKQQTGPLKSRASRPCRAGTEKGNTRGLPLSSGSRNSTLIREGWVGRVRAPQTLLNA